VAEALPKAMEQAVSNNAAKRCRHRQAESENCTAVRRLLLLAELQRRANQ
jgi:hypothetical protein